MEVPQLMCKTHNRMNEIYCKNCNRYICPKCISDHPANGHDPKYVHILHYSPVGIIPKIDSLISSSKGSGKKNDAEILEIGESLKSVVPKLADFLSVREAKCQGLLRLLKTLKSYANQDAKPVSSTSSSDNLAADKKELEKAIASRNSNLAMKLMLKIENAQGGASSSESVSGIAKKMEEELRSLEDTRSFDAAAAAIGLLLAKCQSLGITQTCSDWICDRKYLSTKMSLSEDGLTFGNTASNGYPSIIGSVPFTDGGMYAFEVTPHNLDCTGKEGFGIIEKSKYMAAYSSDNTTPTVRDDIIGFMHSTEAKNIRSEKMSSMQSDAKYYVQVNMVEYIVTITGPGLLLKGDLKTGMEYYPCFSLGCKNNLIYIKPLPDYFSVPTF